MRATRDHRPASAVRAIRFDRTKYGRRLLADAGEVRTDFPDLITGPEPHRLTFHEIALVTAGKGTLDLDGTPIEVAPYRLCITAPGETRTWHLAGGKLDGHLAFFEAELFTECFADPAFLDKFPVLTTDPARRSIALTRRGCDEVGRIVADMRQELACVRADSAHMLRALGYQLVVAVQRHGGIVAEPLDRARMLARAYASLVEQRFADGSSVNDYARMLGVTARHLNHCVRRASGATAHDVLLARIHLEARRLLLGTELSVVEIAERLSFGDASYFTRAFRRVCGATPRAFRVQHGSPVASPIRPLRARRR